MSFLKPRKKFVAMSGIIIAFSFALLLSSCASTAAYQRQIQQWQGKSVDLLIQKWGEPNAVLELANGHKLYQYIRKSFYTTSQPYHQPLQTNRGLFSGYNDPWITRETMVRYCRTTFETNKRGIIIDVRFNGNNCLAYRFFPN